MNKQREPFGWFIASLMAAAMVTPALPAQEPASKPIPPAGSGASGPPTGAGVPPITQDGQNRRAALEKEFSEMLTGATLRGIWQMTGDGGLKSEKPLTPPQPEEYEIISAVKVTNGYWMISARIKFGDKDVTVPVPVRVEWAGDTPVISLNDIPIPAIGTYSARVMFFRGFYSGAWLSNEKNYGGILTGQVIKNAKPEVEKQAAPAPPAEKTP